jgi:hypothetical protein
VPRPSTHSRSCLIAKSVPASRSRWYEAARVPLHVDALRVALGSRSKGRQDRVTKGSLSRPWEHVHTCPCENDSCRFPVSARICGQMPTQRRSAAVSVLPGPRTWGTDGSGVRYPLVELWRSAGVLNRFSQRAGCEFTSQGVPSRTSLRWLSIANASPNPAWSRRFREQIPICRGHQCLRVNRLD